MGESSFKKQIYLFVFVSLLFFVVIAYFVFLSLRLEEKKEGEISIDNNLEVNSFEECVAAGGPVMESYPRQCNSNGKTFVEKINEPDFGRNIRIFEPAPNSVITNPVTVKGEARGTWFFEGDFPLQILDEDGKELTIRPVSAQEDWMTENFVPFEATIDFQETSAKVGTIVFIKDNPSDIRELDDKMVVPVRFANGDVQTKKCIVTGCSSQVCSDKVVDTTCEFRPEFACFREATCELQDNGRCGWTETDELKLCMEEKGIDVNEVKPLY